MLGDNGYERQMKVYNLLSKINLQLNLLKNGVINVKKICKFCKILFGIIQELLSIDKLYIQLCSFTLTQTFRGKYILLLC